MILAINTAQQIHELALIDSSSKPPEILAELSWPNNKNDVEELVPKLQKMLADLGLEKSEITEVLVVTGPGPYTAIRTGVTFANALAEGLNAKLYIIDTFELLKRKAAITHAAERSVLSITNAGGLDVAVNNKVGPLSELLAPFEHDKYVVVSEVTETQSTELRSICLEKNWKQIEGHELQTLGETILTFDLQNLTPTNNAEAIYLKDPVITPSPNPWKKP